jgi:hypothetical protein
MRISVGIFLIAAGAIIAFGIRDTSGPIDFTVVGIVVMLAGAAGIWLSYSVANRKRAGSDDSPVINPHVEEQYNTDPHQYPLQHEIDVTPIEHKNRRV